MPKAKNPITPEEQRKRFEEEVQRLINAGELDPEKADAALDDLVRHSADHKP
jgi:polyhydroxyalkanoate synthesis regulator phasin